VLWTGSRTYWPIVRSLTCRSTQSVPSELTNQRASTIAATSTCAAAFRCGRARRWAPHIDTRRPGRFEPRDDATAAGTVTYVAATRTDGTPTPDPSSHSRTPTWGEGNCRRTRPYRTRVGPSPFVAAAPLLAAAWRSSGTWGRAAAVG